MKTLFTLLTCLTMMTAPVQAQDQILGVFQSTLDRQNYEVRIHGDTMDVYSANGVRVASMERKKAGDDFKGKTEGAIAAGCPNGEGKIETRDVKNLNPDRIPMQVEGPTTNGRCNQILLPTWKRFELVRTTAAATATVAVPAARFQPGQPLAMPDAQTNTGTSVATATLEQMQFQVIDAIAQGKVLTVTMAIMNLGADRQLNTHLKTSQNAALIDDVGKSYYEALITVGNQNWNSEVLNGVRTTMTLTFDNLDTRGGVLEASEIKRLTLPRVRVGAKEGRLEFRDIPIVKNP